MENKTIFKIGDKVYHFRYKWVVIENLKSSGAIVTFEENAEKILCLDYESLSFTEYDFVNGGFSQERPIEIPNRGQIVWVRDSHTGKWVISHFLRMFDGKFITSNTIDDINYSTWNYLTTQNPYENE